MAESVSLPVAIHRTISILTNKSPQEQLRSKIILPQKLSAWCVAPNNAYCAGGTDDGRVFVWEVSEAYGMRMHSSDDRIDNFGYLTRKLRRSLPPRHQTLLRREGECASQYL